MKNTNKEKILIIEDSASYAKILSYSISNALGIDCDIAANFFETKKLIAEKSNHYFLSITDLHLPDCKSGEAVDYVLSKRISCIVITGDLNKKIREELINKSIIDYIVKKDKTTISYLIKLIEKTIRNQSKRILIVDDSKSTRFMISRLLKARKFQVFEAENGENALEFLKENRNIDLIITDYHMPVMNGYELVTKVREIYLKEELAIIGISAQGSGIMSAKFLKNGANDFLKKPFSVEEFYQRIAQNIDILEYIKALKAVSETDYLTGLNNRRYFFEEGKNKYEDYLNEGSHISIAMIDIDFFKKINDKYGHSGGDAVLKSISVMLDGFFPMDDVIARLGGEEFCIIAKNLNPARVLFFFEKLRKKIEKAVVEYNLEKIKFTISIGLLIKATKKFEESINEADKLLYKAKTSGRNKIISKECLN